MNYWANLGNTEVITDAAWQYNVERCRRKAIHAAAPPLLIGPADA